MPPRRSGTAAHVPMPELCTGCWEVKDERHAVGAPLCAPACRSRRSLSPCWPRARGCAGAGRGQHLFLSRAPAHRPAAQGIHGQDRHQGQRRLRVGRPQRAPRRRRARTARPISCSRSMPAGCPRPRTRASRSRSTRRVLKSSDPAQFRDPADHWFGLTMRSRIVYASKERVKQDAITYEELADPEVEGQAVHPLRPARLQHVADRHHDRPQGRGVRPRRGSRA